MTAEAYAYAEGGGEIPKEILLSGYVDRFGCDAVIGRMLGAGEIRRITASENVINAYKSREKSADWRTWAKDHPELNKLLEFGLRLQNGE